MSASVHVTPTASARSESGGRRKSSSESINNVDLAAQTDHLAVQACISASVSASISACGSSSASISGQTIHDFKGEGGGGDEELRTIPEVSAQSRSGSLARKASSVAEIWDDISSRVPPTFSMTKNWDVEVYYANREKERSVTMRDKAYRFLASPASSYKGKCFASLVLLLSILSVFTFGIESTLEARWIKNHISQLQEQGLNQTQLEALTSPLDASRYDDAEEAANLADWRRWNVFLVGFFVVEFFLRLGCYQVS